MGAAAREMLVAAAAHRLDVPPDTLALEHSAIRHKDSGRSVGLGEIAAEAAQLPPPKEPRLKAPRELAPVGRALPRWDIPAKVDGSAVFGIDVVVPQLPGARHWRLAPLSMAWEGLSPAALCRALFDPEHGKMAPEGLAEHLRSEPRVLGVGPRTRSPWA